MIAPLVEVTDAPDGLIELKARDSRGARIGFFQVADGYLDEELVLALKDWQARHAHKGLTLMPPSAAVSA